VNLKCKTELHAKNKIQAINTWCIPVATYSFGVIKWSQTSLQALDRKIRTTMTKHNLHHPHSALETLYLPRNKGGPVLVNIENLCNNQVNNLKKYFLSSELELHQVLANQDKNFSPLNLNEMSQEEIVVHTENKMLESWGAKSLHGKYKKTLCTLIKLTQTYPYSGKTMVKCFLRLKVLFWLFKTK
jgi:hypothetical protein